MADQLFERLRQLRQRIRYVLWIHGLCCLIIALFGTTLLAGGIDWLVRIDDHGTRLLLTLAVLGATGFAAWRFLWRPLSSHFSNVDLARRIERRHPEFLDSLSSTVQFLESRQDPRTGSPELQRAVIQSTLAGLHRVSVSGIVETRVVQRLAGAAVSACLITMAIVAANQAVAGTAINRLLFPLSPVPWPREVELRFVDRDLRPLTESRAGACTVVQGATLDVFVENVRGELPDDLRLMARQPNGQVDTQRMRQATLRDADGRALNIGGATLRVTDGPLFIWALGGDGETQPVQVDVVPPPKIDSFQVTVQPPAYTGESPVELPENVGHVVAIAGTGIVISAHVNKPLASAVFHRHGAEPVPLTVSADGRSVTGEIVFNQPGTGTWWMALRDRQGFENPEAPRHDLQIAADADPSVLMEHPETDLLVTPTASIPLQAVARDDLAVQDLWFEWESSRASLTAGTLDPDQPTSLQEPADGFGIVPEGPGESAGVDGTGEGSRKTVATGDLSSQRLTGSMTFDLAEFSWPVGTRVVIRAAARDWFDLEPSGHVGRSHPRSLTIVSEAEKRSEMADRQAAIVLDLERTEEAQRQNRELVRELQLQVEQTGRLRPEDHDLLKRIELDQRRIRSRLVDDATGLRRQAAAIRRERMENQVEDAVSDRLLSELLDELEFLRVEPLPEIDRGLVDARKLTSGTDDVFSAEQRRDVLETLGNVEEKQGETQRTLSRVLDRLSQWRSERNLNSELRSLSAQQREIAEEARATAEQTRGRLFSELTDQNRADLGRLGNRQQQLAEELDQFRDRLDRAAEALGDSDPEQAQRFRDALQQADASAIGSQMRQAAADFRQNRVGEATAAQQQVLEAMNRLQETLDQRETTDTESLLRQLEEAAGDLAEVRQYAEALHRKLEQLTLRKPEETDPDDVKLLRRQQDRVREKLEETVRRLRRLESPAGRSAQRAATQLKRSADHVDASEFPEATDASQSALDDLQQAQRELAADRNAAEQELAREQMEKLTDQLQAFILRQESVMEETSRLDSARRENGRWNRTLLKSLRNLAEVQRGLADETRSAAGQLSAIEILQITLDSTAGMMDRVAGRLDERNVTARTVQLEERILQRFVDLKAALEDDADGNSSPTEPDGQRPGQRNQSGPDGEVVPVIAQLKMIRSLQVELIDRVRSVRERREATGELSDDDRAELNDAASLQSLLADLTRELTAAFPERPFADEAEAVSDPNGRNSGRSSSGPATDRAADGDAAAGDMPKSGTRSVPGLPPGSPLMPVAAVELPAGERSVPSRPGGANSDAAGEGGTISDLDRDLLRDLVPELETAPPEDTDGLAKPGGPGGIGPAELDRAVRQMRDVSARLQQPDLSERVTQMQMSVVEDIDQLIERLKQAPPPQPNPDAGESGDSSPAPGGVNAPPDTPQSTGMPESGGNQSREDQAQAGQNPGKAAESEAERERETREAEAALSVRRTLINEVWGHLPPSVRDRLLNVPSEKLLPGYDVLIRRYYEALAEPDSETR